jgi:hypothetical protein
MLIRENVLKKIWFYLDRGIPLEPDDYTATQKSISFYWPPNENYIDPYVFRPGVQKQYTIKDIKELRDPSNVGYRSTPDKRIGCIPSLGAP